MGRVATATRSGDTYTVTLPNGGTLVRKSSRDFSHVVLRRFNNGAGSRPWVASYTSAEARAEKVSRTGRQYGSSIVLKIVPLPRGLLL